MSDYSKITNFLSKDSLALNDPAKYVKGSEIDAEFNAIAVAVATKANTDSPTLTTPNIGAATGTSLVLSGALTATGAFTSLGLDDNATAVALTLSGSGANSVTIANSATNPTIGTSAGGLQLNGSGGTGLLIDSSGNVGLGTTAGFSAIAAGMEIQDASVNVGLRVERTGTGPSAGELFAGSGVLRLNTSGAYPIGFGTNNVEQVRILDTAAADRYITLTGSNGGNPTIGTSAGSLSLTSAVVTTSTLTVGTNLFANGYGQVNSNDATPAGGGGDHGIFIGSGAIGITVGSGLPTSTVADGSIYIRTDGGSGTTIYQRRAGNWIATAA